MMNKDILLRRIEYLFLFLLIVFIFLYNLEIHPRPWHDEGAALTLAKTLVQNGVYAVKNSDGYQTFGAVQSAGPTVILPISLVFHYFGVGLLQGRLIGAMYSVLALITIFICSHKLYGRWVGYVCIMVILSAPVIEYIFFGRQAGADTAGLSFFMISALALFKSEQRRKVAYSLILGLSLGLAIISKSQYLLFGVGALGIVILSEIFYYRSGITLNYILSLAIAVFMSLGWQFWQRSYFGDATYLENLEKLRLLSSAVYGFYPSRIIEITKSIITTGPLYIWGLVGWLYQIPDIVNKSNKAKTLLYLWSFFILWFLYTLLFAAPQSQIPLMGTSIMAIFIGKMIYDIIITLKISIKEQRWRNEVERNLMIGCSIALLAFIIPLGYGLLNRLSDYVISSHYNEAKVSSNPESWVPLELITYLNKNIHEDSVIETWERELGILTSHNYHFPDQSLRSKFYYSDIDGIARADKFDGQYLSSVKADYLIIGPYARYFNTYDLNNESLTLLTSFSVYDIYKVSNAP